ncbi:MAG: phosphonate metabolism protein/1,5-bisphosphokinase (PRPP-forming) PhnN [Ferrovibrio sp.]|nr:phosphonate metabolism protein/1,5-bisphosphokinase (PRPP-forming) PhnN [Ferrovibrio sp.]
MVPAKRPRFAGRLTLVVGPSGVGKDSLMNAAQQALRDDPAVVFPRRVITRAANMGGEDYIAIDDARFEAMRKNGEFALYWLAHGLRYGVPIAIEAELQAGRQVVVNVSRAIIAEARRAYPGLQVIAITAPPALLRQRLEARGRESPVDIAQRLARAAAFDLGGEPDVVELSNDGPLEQGVARLLALLRG